jgi:hypothetical protein
LHLVKLQHVVIVLEHIRVYDSYSLTRGAGGCTEAHADHGAGCECVVIVTSVTKFPIKGVERRVRRTWIDTFEVPDREGCSSSERLVRYETWNTNILGTIT